MAKPMDKGKKQEEPKITKKVPKNEEIEEQDELEELDRMEEKLKDEEMLEKRGEKKRY